MIERGRKFNTKTLNFNAVDQEILVADDRYINFNTVDQPNGILRLAGQPH